jgi:hypothetical protein
MNPLRSHLRSLAWLALAAMLGLALLPGVSHAPVFVRGDGPDLAEICTAQGMRTITPDAGSDRTPAPQATGAADCPFCPQGGHTPGLQQALPRLAPPEPARCRVPAPSLQAPRTALAWAAAQPRAPPQAG